MTVTTNYLVTGNGITGSTANAVQALVSGIGFSAVTYDAQGRVVGYALNGATHTIAYPNSATVVLSNDSESRTVGLDTSGRVVSIT